MAEIYCVKIDKEINNNIFNQLISLLHTEDKDKIMRYRFKNDRDRGLVGRLLVNFIFYKKYSINSILRIHFDKHKRPYQVYKREVDFNISHSGKWVICAVSEVNKVGVDIQEINERVSTDIGIRFFSDKEAAELSTLDGWKKRLYFFQIWTLKESYIKAKSKTFSIPLNSFYFDVTHKESPRFFTNIFEEQNSWSFKSFCIDNNNYWLSMCSSKEDRVEKPVFINIEALINRSLVYFSW